MIKKSHETGSFDPYRRFIEAVPSLVKIARQAAEMDAYSYRGFKVGAAAEVVIPSTSEVDVFAAGNTKVEHKTKVCAERKVLGKIAKLGITEIVGLVVVGTTDREKIAEVTDFPTPTLHPCGECQGMFVDHRLVHDHTLVVTAGLVEDDRRTGDWYQVHTAEELRRHYEEGNDYQLNANVRDFNGWNDRLSLYDALQVSKSSLAKKKLRSDVSITKMALTADIQI